VRSPTVQDSRGAVRLLLKGRVFKALRCLLEKHPRIEARETLRQVLPYRVLPFGYVHPPTRALALRDCGRCSNLSVEPASTTGVKGWTRNEQPLRGNEEG
jgi:hypothetical protein